jgi:hypothetical protein
MQTILDNVKAALYAPSRRVVGRVVFDITDVTAYGDVNNITYSTQAEYNNANQLANRERVSTYKIATYENNLFSLDGSFTFPDSTIANNGETSFVSQNLGDSNGNYSVTPNFKITFNSTHSSAGLTVTFDLSLNEYAVDYDVTVRDNGGGVITTVNVRGNDKVIDEAIGQLSNYKSIEITILKWSKPYRRARVQEVDFGIVREYENTGLIRFDLIENMDLTSIEVPNAEFSFTVENTDRAFNILNPTGFYKYLQQRQKIDASFGVELDSGSNVYIPLGRYYLMDWKSEEGSMTATFTARTSLDLMESYTYENTVANSWTLGTFAEALFNYCNVSNYKIDPFLYSIGTNGLANKTNCKTILQMIAQAGTCNIFVDRNGIINLKKIDTITSSQDVIDFNNTYAEPQIQLEKIVKTVEVTYFDDLDTNYVYSITDGSINEGELISITGNTLINSTYTADLVANWIFNQKNQRRAIYNINFRGNPSHELGDVVEIQNSYGTNTLAILTKNEFHYEGYLQANTEAKGNVS